MPAESTLQYLKVDYQSQKDALLQRVRSRFPGVWNDFLSNSIGIMLIDLVAFALTTYAYMTNRLAAENFLPTMTLRESAVRVGRLVAYQLRSATPATVACEATIAAAQSSTLTLAKGTVVRTSGTVSLPFELAEDYTIEAQSTTPYRLIAVFSPNEVGASTISTQFSVTQGSAYADVVDTTVDLSQYIQPGQVFGKRDAGVYYTIQALEKAPGSVSDYSRLTLATPYVGSTEITDAEVVERRILLVQGLTVTERAIAPAGSTSGYVLKLNQTPVIDNSIEVTVNGAVWSGVSLLGTASSTDEVYQPRTYVDGNTCVLFGDGDFGKALPSEAAITVTYRIGGGSSGNIPLNSINATLTGYLADISSPITVAITNATSTGVGGRDAESLDEARRSIPSHARANDRAVTLEDYQTLAGLFSSPQYGSVAYARATLRRENMSLDGNVVAVYAWTTSALGGLTTLSPPMKQSLQDYLQTRCVSTDMVQVFDGTSRPVPVSLRFWTTSGYSIADTQRLVSGAIQTLINRLRPGDPLYYSQLVSTVSALPGVANVTIATPVSDLQATVNTELFTAPQDSYVYAISRTGVGTSTTDDLGALVGNYAAQLPIAPLAAWSVKLFIGANALAVLPGTQAGYARLLGENLSQSDEPAFQSTINLTTGQVSLWLKGTPGDLTLQLISVKGYSVERPVNMYVGYVGDNSQSKRREIRSVIRAWCDGLTVGGAMYARQVSGITASRVSLTDVVESVSGVDAVTRIALDTPANNDARVTATDYSLLRAGTIVINGQSD